MLGYMAAFSYVCYVINELVMILEPLINRMKTDDVNRMIEYSHKYPISGQSLIDTLMESTIWLDLKYDTICELNDVFGCGYSPTAISDLFEK